MFINLSMLLTPQHFPRDKYLNIKILFFIMKTPTKRGLVFIFVFISILFSTLFVSAEEPIKISKFANPFFIYGWIVPIMLGLITFFISLNLLKSKLENKRWLKGGIIGFVTSIVYSFGRFIPFFIYRERSEGYGLGLIATIFTTPFYIIGITIVFSIIFAVVDYVRKNTGSQKSITQKNSIEKTLSFIKIGFFVGIAIAVMILFFWFRYIMYYGSGLSNEYWIYTIIAALIAIVVPTLIGFITQKIKDKSNWQNWNYTKKGFIAGVVSSVIILISWIIYILLEGGIFREGIGHIFKDSMGNFILGSSIILPIFLFTLIGWVIRKIKSS